MSSMIERILWTLQEHEGEELDLVARAIIREIESTHRIVDPDTVSEDMLNACFSALPEHYSPPDPKRRQWHGYKAKKRYTAMVKATKKLLCTDIKK